MDVIESDKIIQKYIYIYVLLKLLECNWTEWKHHMTVCLDFLGPQKVPHTLAHLHHIPIVRYIEFPLELNNSEQLHGGFHQWGIPNNWVLDFMEIHNLKWMIWGYPHLRTLPYLLVVSYLVVYWFGQVSVLNHSYDVFFVFVRCISRTIQGICACVN